MIAFVAALVHYSSIFPSNYCLTSLDLISSQFSMLSLPPPHTHSWYEYRVPVQYTVKFSSLWLGIQVFTIFIGLNYRVGVWNWEKEKTD